MAKRKKQPILAVVIEVVVCVGVVYEACDLLWSRFVDSPKKQWALVRQNVDDVVNILLQNDSPLSPPADGLESEMKFIQTMQSEKHPKFFAVFFPKPNKLVTNDDSVDDWIRALDAHRQIEHRMHPKMAKEEFVRSLGQAVASVPPVDLQSVDLPLADIQDAKPNLKEAAVSIEALAVGNAGNQIPAYVLPKDAKIKHLSGFTVLSLRDPKVQQVLNKNNVKFDPMADGYLVPAVDKMLTPEKIEKWGEQKDK